MLKWIAAGLGLALIGVALRHELPALKRELAIIRM
jgi:hypothetical protein